MNYLKFFVIFCSAGFLTLIFTLLIKTIAERLKLFDWPSPRRIHPKPLPRLGGLAMFAAFVIVVLFFTSSWGGHFLVLDKHLVGFLVGATILVIAMVFDDIYGLSPSVKFFWQLVATLVIIALGIGIDFITNPWGGVYLLNQYQIPISIAGNIYHINILADLFTLVWVIGMINVVNFLDGLDGLAAGISAIAASVIFFLSLRPSVNQPTTALLAIVLAGVAAGFLIMNFHPAKIFMGDTGSHFLGFSLALLAIFSGGKVATALLVLGFPIFDGLWVVANRIVKKQSPFLADKSHLHHRLLELGFSQREVVLFFYLLCASFGIISLFLKSWGKLIALSVLGGVILIIFIVLFVIALKRQKATR